MLAASAWVGALAARPVRVEALIGLAAVGAVVTRGARGRRPHHLVVGCVVVGALASGLSAHDQGDRRPVPTGEVSGSVEVREDPERFGAAVRLVVRHHGIDLEAWVRGATGREVERRAVGEWIELEGTVRPMDAGWRLDQGVLGRLEIREVHGWRRGGPVDTAANGLRRTLAEGASAMEESDAALFMGLVLGDRRGHDALTDDAFEGSGLTHLLAVSGDTANLGSWSRRRPP